MAIASRHSQCRPGESQDDIGEVCTNCITTVIASAAKQSRLSPRRDSGLLRCARNDGVWVTTSLFQLAFPIADTPSPSRGSSRPSFASSLHPQMKEGAGKAGSRLAPIDRHARCRLRYDAQRVTGQPETSRPSLRSGWNGLCRALPGERCTIAPVALRMADARGPVGPHTSPQNLAHRPRAPGRHDLAVRRSHRSCARFRSRLSALRCLSRRCDPRPPPPGPRS
ncbi:hypothetical protein ABIE88_006917 [Bradyrhizobium diazoefficiens]